MTNGDSTFETDSIEDGVIDQLGDEDTPVPYKYEIASYGSDMPVDGLVKRLQDGSILVPPFQRGYVWSLNKASSFIESLLLGLPVPGVFFSREPETGKQLIIDGQQRLLSLLFFYSGRISDGKRVFALKGVHEQYEALTYATLEAPDRRRLDDSIIHATVVQQLIPSNDKSSIYLLFERLNTGGVNLTSQEVRTALYHGPLIELIAQLNTAAAWRTIFGPVSQRMKDQELILRFLAMLNKGHDYARPMKEFLNNYLGDNRFLPDDSRQAMTSDFCTTIDFICSALGESAFRPDRQINAAVFDSVMVATARALKQPLALDPKIYEKRYHQLLVDDNYTAACAKATANDASVVTRMARAWELLGATT